MTDSQLSRTPTFVLAASIALAGLFIGHGFSSGRTGDRYVTVKGVAEQEVRANLAVWPIHVTGAANDLGAANDQVARSITRVRSFLAKHGLDTTQVQLTAFTVSDAQANEYGGMQRSSRYIIKQTLLVRSNDPDRVLTASQQISELATLGVAISSGSEYGNQGPSFIFTNLNELKPPMIAQATARAREAAEQFAKDSHSKLGGIRRANQGVFEILPRDPAPGVSEENQITKIVRVVSTVDYYLR